MKVFKSQLVLLVLLFVALSEQFDTASSFKAYKDQGVLQAKESGDVSNNKPQENTANQTSAEHASVGDNPSLPQNETSVSAVRDQNSSGGNSTENLPKPNYPEFAELPVWAKYLLGGFGILFGATLVFWGYRFITLSIFLIAGFIVAFALYGLLQSTIPVDYTAKATVVYVSSLIAWLLSGCFFACVPKSGFVILGASVGAMIALILNPFALQYVWPESPMSNLYIWMAIFGFLTGLLVVWFERPTLILATVLSGSYLCLASLGEFVGHFPTLSSMGHMDWQGWAYFGGFLGLVVVGSVIQFRITARYADHSDRAKSFDDF